MTGAAALISIEVPLPGSSPPVIIDF